MRPTIGAIVTEAFRQGIEDVDLLCDEVERIRGERPSPHYVYIVLSQLLDARRFWARRAAARRKRPRRFAR